MSTYFLVVFICRSQNGDILKNNTPVSSPFLMPGHPFPLAAAAAAAAAAGIPVSLPNPTSAINKDKPEIPGLPGYPFPFFRPPVNNVMNQVTQTQQALLTMMRNAQAHQKELKRSAATKREDQSALDLTSIDSPPPPKRIRRNTDTDTASSVSNTVSLCSLVSPCSHEAKEVKSWSVEDVCKFVGTVELCQPFVEVNI